MAERTLDRIHIRQLRTRCIVGIYPEERKKTQEVEISLTIYADLSKPAQSDSIEDTIDYKAVKKDVLELVENSQYYLVERLAGRIAEVVLAYPGVEAVDVTLDKPGALRFARSVAVELTRTRET